MPELSEAKVRYLDAARAAGMVAELQGHRYVAAEYSDPVTGRRHIFVEYCNHPLFADASLRARLRAELSTAHPGVSSILVRTEPLREEPDPPWQPSLTYVRWAGDAGTLDPDIRPAEPGERELVRKWLVQAFVAAGIEQASPVTPERALAVANQVLDTDGCIPLVLLDRGTAIGHATLLTDSYDDVRDLRYVELFDALVEPDHDVRAGMRRLAAAAAWWAARDGRPLIGNVVHPVTPDLRGKGKRIVASLIANGWSVDHEYWTAPVQGMAR